MTTWKLAEANCLLGQPMPEPLKRLWEAAANNDPFIQDSGLVLLTSRDALLDVWREHTKDDDPGTVANGKAHLRIFERLAMIAHCDDGEILAFDLQTGPADDPPILQVDDEGQYEWLGINLGEALFRIAEFREEEDEAAAWIAAQEIPFRRPGELGSTTGHLPDFGDIYAAFYDTADGRARAPFAPPTAPAIPTDILTWAGRPGVEVLHALRTVLGLEPHAFPNEHWLCCDGAGRVSEVHAHETSGLTLGGVAFGSPRALVVANLGEPTKQFDDGKRVRYERDGHYILFAFEADRVTSMFIGRDD